MTISLRTDIHISKSDPKLHYTVDAYGRDGHGRDLPIGCIHVYLDTTVSTFEDPRTKAWDVSLLFRDLEKTQLIFQ